MGDEPGYTKDWCECCKYAGERLRWAHTNSSSMQDWSDGVYLYSNVMRHHANFVALEGAAAAGCPLCRLMRQQLIYDHGYQAMLQDEKEILVGVRGEDGPPPRRVHVSVLTIFAPRSIGIGSAAKNERMDDKFSRLTGVSARETNGCNSSDQSSSQGICDTKQDLSRLVDEVLKPWIDSTGPVVPDPTSNDVEQGVSVQIPTRLIEVSDGNTHVLRLIVTSPEQCQTQHYVALSYCWGAGNAAACTTKDNLTSRLDNLEYSELPPSIQHAIDLTRALKHQYLWVDALCIIQAGVDGPTPESEADWNREAVRMGSYYANASFTIAASRSQDSADGFLDFMEAQRYTTGKLLVSQMTPKQGNTNSISRLFKRSRAETEADTSGAAGENHEWYLLPADLDPEAALARSPLNSRGWVLQERLSSKRIIHFCEDAVLLEFSGIMECAASPLKPPMHKMPQRPPSSYSAASPEYIPVTQLFARTEDDLQKAWLEMIMQYSQMAFSFESDRLVAVQGIADRLLASFPDGYSAGVFREATLDQLLLTPKGRRKKKQDAENGGKSGEEVVAQFPSWSWASLGGRKLEITKPSKFSDSVLSPTEFMVQLLELDAFPLGRHTVRSPTAALTVSGVVRGLKWGYNSHRQTDHSGDFLVDSCPRASGGKFNFKVSHSFRMRFDDGTDPLAGHAFRAVCLGVKKAEAWGYGGLTLGQATAGVVCGLIVEATGVPGEFRRIGVFWDHCNPWCWRVWERSPMRTVRVV